MDNNKRYERLDKMADLLDAMADVIAEMKVDCLEDMHKEQKCSPEIERFFDRVEYTILYPTKNRR